MSDLLVNIFGMELSWSVSTTVLVLILVELALVAVALAVFIVLMVRKYAISRSKQNILVTEAAADEKERMLVGITLDTSVVQREFKVGETFNCEGLVVTANYTSEPAHETVTDFTVERPSTDFEGKPTVTVRYGKVSAYYTVSVVAAEEERVPVGMTVDPSAAKCRFTAGEAFSSEGIVVCVNYNREPYSEIVEDYTVEPPVLDAEGEYYVTVRRGDLFATYPVTVAERKLTGIELDLGVVKTDFIIGEDFDYTGLNVIALYSGEPETEPVTDFTVEAPALTAEGMFNVTVRYGGFVQTYPIFVTAARSLVDISLDVSSVRREFAAGEEFGKDGLIVYAHYDAEPFTEQVEDYEITAPDTATAGEKEVYINYRGKTASYAVTVAEPVVEEAPAEPVEEPVVEEAPAEEPEDETEGGVLRYDRSFTARIIQSADPVKEWYNTLKNELLSYRKVKDRMSWKCETYRIGRDPIAKFSFRGKVLCVSLALDPAQVDVAQYKIEDVSGNKSFEGTPCMYRIKNDLRAKRACELIANVMASLGTEKTDRVPEDYYQPYEGILTLVKKGLAKRMIVANINFAELKKSPEEGEAAVAEDETPAADGEENV